MALFPTSAEFLVQLFILLSAAIVAGEIAGRLGLIPLVGQLIVGVILGPTLLGPYIGLTSLTPELTGLQFLATFFIMFMAGLHVDPDEIAHMKAGTALVGVAIFGLPFAFGAVAVALVEPGLPVTTDMFAALTLSITALPVMGIMVAEFGLGGKRLGNLVMGAALVNELTAVTVFAILLQLALGGGSSFYAASLAVVSVGLFLAGVLLISRVLKLVRESAWWRKRPDRMSSVLRSREAGFAVLMAMALGAALYSQLLGLTFLVGAFYAGLLVTQATGDSARRQSFLSIFSTMNWMFFVPLFFALVGVEMDLTQLGGLLALGAWGVLLAMAIATKVGTGAGLARALGLSAPDSVAAGFLLSSRGAVELAMAVLLLADGVFSVGLFTTIALVGLVTTILAPLGALWAWRSTPASRADLTERMSGGLPARALQLNPASEVVNGAPLPPPPDRPTTLPLPSLVPPSPDLGPPPAP